MHKKIILLSLLILTILIGLLTYVNNVFLPIKLKEIIVREASKTLNRSVAIESLYYVPLKGLVCKNVVILDKEPQTEKIFSAQEISVSIFYIPLIFQKKVIIPSIVIDSPCLQVSRERTGAWNFQDLLEPSQGKQEHPSLAAYIAGLTITNGTIIFFDKNVAREAMDTIENINVQASLALPQNMKATVKIFPRKPGSLKVFADINYDFISKDFLCQLRAENLILEKFSAYINQPGITLKKAKINVAALNLTQRAGKISGNGEVFMDTVELAIQEKNTIQLTPTITVAELGLSNGQWNIKGRADIKSAECLLEGGRNLTSDITYTFLATHSEQKTTVEGSIALPALSAKIGQEANLLAQAQGKLNFALVNNVSQLETQLRMNNAQVSFKPNAQFTDNPTLNLILSYDPSLKEAPLRYTLTLSFANGKIINLPVVQTAENISGKISLEPNKFTAESFSGVVSQTPLSFSGSITNFRDPWLNISVSATNLNLSSWKSLLDQYLPKNDIDLKGITTFNIKYKGKFKKLAGSSLDCNISLKDAAFKNQAVADGVVGISGDILYKVANLDPSHYLPDNGSWENVRFTFQGKPYVLDGTLQFNNLNTSIKCEDLSLILSSKLFPDRLKIISLDGQYKRSQASIKGEVFYPKDSHGPKFNIKAAGTLILEDLSSLSPSLKEKMTLIDPKGVCTIDGLFVGTPTQWRDWALAFTLQSEKIRLYGYEFQQLSIKYDQRDRFINNCSLSSTVYEGLVTAQASSDLSIDEMPYKIAINIKDLNFAKLKNDTPLKDKDISGTLAANYAGTGPLAHPLLSQGQGFLSIKNGKLWQFEVFKGLAQLLFVPGKENITLDSAESQFSVVSQKVLVKDALIKGNQVELSCNGSASFQGEIDFDIVSRFAEGVIRSSDSLQKTVAAFLSQAEDFLTVKVTGTLKEPKYKVIPKPLNVIQKTKDFIFDALPNIFQ